MLKKLLKVFGVILGLFFVLIIGAAIFSPEKAPESQTIFTQQLNEFRSTAKDVEESANQIQIKKLEALYDSFINENREVKDWYAKVVSISASDDGSILIKTSYTDEQHDSYLDYAQLFNLIIEKDSGVQALSHLTQGDDIFFSGSLGEEMSITFSGSLEQPEYYFKPKSVKLALDGQTIDL
ncbi:MAG: hypothetical protein AAGJ88_04310 [Pseudomonadota bacterium]